MFSFPVNWCCGLPQAVADMHTLLLLPGRFCVPRVCWAALKHIQGDFTGFCQLYNCLEYMKYEYQREQMFYANSDDLGLWALSSSSQLCDKAGRLENLQQEEEEDLLAAPNITGSRAPGQGLDLGRDKESWAYSVHSQIQMFERWGSGHPS